MRKLELRILVVSLAIFLVLFTFIPEGKEHTIFNETIIDKNITYNDYEDNIIVKQIVSGNNSGGVLNLSDKDKFIFENELEESNKLFEELNNNSNISFKLE